MKRIKSGDTVIVVAGKSKGHVGKVLRVADQAAVVEGANMIKKHVKPNPNLQQKGGIIASEAPLHISNIAMYEPNEKRASRVGFRYAELADGTTKKVRYFKLSDKVIDPV